MKYTISKRLHEFFWKERRYVPLPEWVKIRLREYAIACGKAKGVWSSL